MRTRNFLLSMAVLLTSAASAQLSLDWWTVNGGGGTSVSTDGRFELSGTAGQPDAGAMAAGAFFLEGGFWGGLLPPPPSLWIVRLPSGALEVSWPAWARDYRLEQAPTVTGSPERWAAASPVTYQNDGTRFYVTIPPPSGTQFYRLRQVCLGP